MYTVDGFGSRSCFSMFFNLLGSAPWAWYLVLLSRSAELRNRKCHCEVNSFAVLKPRKQSEAGKNPVRRMIRTIS